MRDWLGERLCPNSVVIVARRIARLLPIRRVAESQRTRLRVYPTTCGVQRGGSCGRPPVAVLVLPLTQHQQGCTAFLSTDEFVLDNWNLDAGFGDNAPLVLAPMPTGRQRIGFRNRAVAVTGC